MDAVITSARRLFDLSPTIELDLVTYKGLPAPLICRSERLLCGMMIMSGPTSSRAVASTVIA